MAIDIGSAGAQLLLTRQLPHKKAAVPGRRRGTAAVFLRDPREEERAAAISWALGPVIKTISREEEADLPYERSREEDKSARFLPLADACVGAVSLAATEGGGNSRRRNQALGGG